MKPSSRRLRIASHAGARRGATLVLTAVLTTALASLGALIINWSYIELSNTQLRSATDAAAKAAAVTLRETQNQNQARNAAKQLVQEFTVGGQTMQLSNEDIEFGHARKEESGKYTFVTDEEPINCARVTARCGNGGSAGSIQVFFSNIVSPGSFDLQKEAIAGRYDHDVCIVLDRSGSMAWDLTGDEFSYPSEFNNDSTLQNYFRPPYMGVDSSQEDPNLSMSRWGAAVDVVEKFRLRIEERKLRAKLGLASFASDYTFGLFVSERATEDQQLDFDTQLAVDAAHAISDEPLIGDTTIAAGINYGRRVLMDSSHRRNTTSERTMILLSDGAFGGGLRGNALNAASRALDNRIKIHTISFNADEDGGELLEAIATATGGNYYSVVLGSEGDAGSTYEMLEQAFLDIADRLPGSLIQ